MTSKTIMLGVLLSVCVVCSSAGQESPKEIVSGQALHARGGIRAPNEQGGDRPTLHSRTWRYRLRPGDVLELTFPFTPEFNQKAVTVQPDGYLTLPALGELRAEGQTMRELTEALRTAYKKILHDPVIIVDLKDFEKPYFIVGGEVGHPGKFDLRSDLTVAQAVAIAGGFRETAKHSQVLLFRRVSDDWAEVKKLNLKRMLRAGSLREDPHLQPGDMLFVPKNTISKIQPFISIVQITTWFSRNWF